jgi:hypothetical protein
MIKLKGIHRFRHLIVAVEAFISSLAESFGDAPGTGK